MQVQYRDVRVSESSMMARNEQGLLSARHGRIGCRAKATTTGLHAAGKENGQWCCRISRRVRPIPLDGSQRGTSISARPETLGASESKLYRFHTTRAWGGGLLHIFSGRRQATDVIADLSCTVPGIRGLERISTCLGLSCSRGTRNLVFS